MKSGRYLLDHPSVMRLLSQAGRTLVEDRPATSLSSDQKDTIEQRINEIHELQFSKPDEWNRRQGELTNLYQQLYPEPPEAG